MFDAHPGKALNATVVDIGTGFRMIVNPVDVIAPPKPLPRLPVARAVWKPEPNLAASAWIEAGGAHHTAFSYDVTASQLADFAAMAGVEMRLISADR